MGKKIVQRTTTEVCTMLKRLGSILCAIVFTSVLALQTITINANAFVTTLDSDFHGTWVVQTWGLIFPSGKKTVANEDSSIYYERQIDLNTGTFYNLCYNIFVSEKLQPATSRGVSLLKLLEWEGNGLT